MEGPSAWRVGIEPQKSSGDYDPFPQGRDRRRLVRQLKLTIGQATARLGRAGAGSPVCSSQVA